jgi:hypothetical protein
MIDGILHAGWTLKSLLRNSVPRAANKSIFRDYTHRNLRIVENLRFKTTDL